MQKIGYKPNNKWLLQYAFHYSETSPYGRYDRHNRTKNGLPRYGEWNYGPQIWLMNWFSATYEQQNKYFDKMMLKAAHQYFQESRINRNFYDTIRYINLEQVDAFSVNADFIKTLNKKHILMYGAEAVQNYVLSNGWQENINTQDKVKATPRYPKSLWQTYAAYLMDEWKIAEEFTLQSAARVTNYQLSSKFDTSVFPLPFSSVNINHQALTGSIGAVWQASDKFIVGSNLSTAFRAPNVDDIGKIFDSEPGAVVVPNPNLKAEYAYNADVSLTKLFGKSLKLETSFFYTYLDNAIVRRNYTINGQDSIMYQGEMSRVQALQNAAKSYRYGTQVALKIILNENFTFKTNVNYQMGEDEMSDNTVSPSRHAAPLFGVARIDYKHKKWHLQFYTEYQAGKLHKELSVEEQGKTEIYALDENGQTYVPEWFTLNFKAQYTFYEKLIFNAGIENITDVRYRPYSSGISAPGRNLKASLVFTF